MRPPHLLSPRLHLHWVWPHCGHPCAGNRAVEHAQRRIAERAIRGGLDGRSLRPQRECATGSGAGGVQSRLPVSDERSVWLKGGWRGRLGVPHRHQTTREH